MKTLAFIALIAIIYLAMAVMSSFATWFAQQPFGWVAIPAAITLIVAIARAAFKKEQA